MWITPLAAALSYNDITFLSNKSFESSPLSKAVSYAFTEDFKLDITDLFLALRLMLCLALFFADALLFAIIKALFCSIITFCQWLVLKEGKNKVIYKREIISRQC